MNRRQLVVHWICAAVVFGSLFLRLPVLWDVDSYYHVAVARHYVEHGPLEPIPWLRFSLLSGGADKELLFHLLLMPFAALPDPAIGGRIALALLNATIATVVAALAMRAIGGAALALPLWLWITAPPFFARIIRLRPELLALLLILLVIPVAAKGRLRLLAVLSFAFAAGYTAFHVLIGLVVLWQAWRWYDTRRLDLRPIVVTVAGVAAGLLLRPYPLENLRLWFVQNVLFFRHISQLDVGLEIFPPPIVERLIESSIWLGTLIVLAVVAWRRQSSTATVDRALLAFMAITAAVFFLLFLRMGRMATYVYPLVTLAIVLAMAGRLRERVVVVILIVTSVAALFLTFDRDVRDAALNHATRSADELDWWNFGRAVPPNAKVAATWGGTEGYVFWAPQGRYLNALDPIFMALPYPREYAAQRRLFEGRDPDVPRTLAAVLDSDYLALDWTTASRLLVERLRDDPRLEVVYGGFNALFRVRRERERSFIVDWSPLPPARDEVAGFVDASALARDGCATVRHTMSVAEPQRVHFLFAPWGPSKLSVDGTLRTLTEAAPRALLRHAARVEANLAAGEHTLEVHTCRADDLAGFYLRMLPAGRP